MWGSGINSESGLRTTRPHRNLEIFFQIRIYASGFRKRLLVPVVVVNLLASCSTLILTRYRLGKHWLLSTQKNDYANSKMNVTGFLRTWERRTVSRVVFSTVLEVCFSSCIGNLGAAWSKRHKYQVLQFLLASLTPRSDVPKF